MLFQVLIKILCFWVCLIQLTEAYERLMLQTWTDPETTQYKDYFEVYNGFPAYSVCSNNKYFGLFNNGVEIYNDKPSFTDKFYVSHNNLSGQFLILLVDVIPLSNDLDTSDITVEFNEDAPEVQSVTQLPDVIQCNGQPVTPNALYLVKFELDHRLDVNYPLLAINVNIQNQAKQWGIRQLMMRGNICRSDCLNCDNDANVCTKCEQYTKPLLPHKNICECKAGYSQYSVAPVKCAQDSIYNIIETRCYLEYVEYLRSTIFSSECQIEKILGQDHLACKVNTTESFPIQDSCCVPKNVYFCYQTTKEYKKPTCFNTTTNGQAVVIHNRLQSYITIPTDQMIQYSLNSTLYQPNTTVSTFNFTMAYNHNENNGLNPQIPFINFTWQTVVMQENRDPMPSPIIFNLFQPNYDSIVPLSFLCKDQFCTEEAGASERKFKDQTAIYFKLYCDFPITGQRLEVIEIKLLSMKKSKVWDLKSMMTAIVDNDFEQIYQVQLDLSSRRYMRNLQWSDQSFSNGNARLLLKKAFVDQSLTSFLQEKFLQIQNPHTQTIKGRNLQSHNVLNQRDDSEFGELD